MKTKKRKRPRTPSLEELLGLADMIEGATSVDLSALLQPESRPEPVTGPVPPQWPLFRVLVGEGPVRYGLHVRAPNDYAALTMARHMMFSIVTAEESYRFSSQRVAREPLPLSEPEPEDWQGCNGFVSHWLEFDPIDLRIEGVEEIG